LASQSGSDAPANFKAFLNTLPKLTPDKPAFGFVTQWLWSGDGCNFLEKTFAQKGYQLRWTMEFNMFNNISLPVVPLPFEPDTEKMASRLDQLRVQVSDFCLRIVQDESYRMHNRWHDKLAAWIQRGPFRVSHDLWGRYWSVDAKMCTGCERCARICPVSNITMTENVARHGDYCIMCLRCFNFCPEIAIKYLGAGNTRLEKKPPFQGPVAEFKPEFLTKKI
jgi:ferredoxin